MIELKDIKNKENMERLYDLAANVYTSNNKALKGITFFSKKGKDEYYIEMAIERKDGYTFHKLSEFPPVLQKEINSQDFKLYNKIK